MGETNHDDVPMPMRQSQCTQSIEADTLSSPMATQCILCTVRLADAFPPIHPLCLCCDALVVHQLHCVYRTVSGLLSSYAGAVPVHGRVAAAGPIIPALPATGSSGVGAIESSGSGDSMMLHGSPSVAMVSRVTAAASAGSHQTSSHVVALEGFSRIETIVTLVSWIMALKDNAR